MRYCLFHLRKSKHYQEIRNCCWEKLEKNKSVIFCPCKNTSNSQAIINIFISYNKAEIEVHSEQTHSRNAYIVKW